VVVKHDVMFFMTYTNSLLIEDNTAARLSELGSFTPAILMEGFRKKTRNENEQKSANVLYK